MFADLFGGVGMFIRGDAQFGHEEHRLGHKDHMFKAWSGPPRHTKKEHDAKMEAINANNGIDSILKRAMGNRKAMFKRT